jgi:glycosyltransferase involved in cell wall biosynthesis
MKIVIDGRMMMAGQGTYTRHLLEELQQLDRANDYVVLVRRADFDRLQFSSEKWTKQVADYGQYSFKEQLLLPWTLYRLRADVVHFISYNLPLLYLRPYVATVHDLTLVRFKNRRPGWRGWFYGVKFWAGRLALWWVCKRAARILVPSTHVKNELVGRYAIEISKVIVTYEAATPPPVQKKVKGGELGKYLLAVGNPYPHKNIGRLIKAFALLKGDAPALKLVLVGGTGGNENLFDPLRKLVDSLGLEHEVVFAGYLQERELWSFYQRALLYVFPSLSEGFGLPGLEAMAAGLPVAAARATCLPEVYGEAAVYFDPNDPGDMARVMASVINSPRERKRLVEAGLRQVKKYSWKKMGEQTLAVYKSMGS